MPATADEFFRSCFRGLCADREPLRWQCRLFALLTSGQVPPTVTLPTGLGKTSVILIWLIALAEQAPTPTLPRRLVYIVNRRTVVDQASADAERLLELLKHPGAAGAHEATVCRLRDALARIAGDTTTTPLAVSTLRGELADNGEWKQNPARPAIIIGTIDMIGSKLLFSGYGDGRYGRAHHAGLIGQDSLIVHDEAHLSPAFSALLRSVEQEQQRESEHGRARAAITRPIRVMELSATTRGEAPPHNAFALEPDDDQDAIVTQRRAAKKALSFQPCEAGRGELARVIAARALAYRDKAARVLVYVRSPEDAKAVADAITNARPGLGDNAKDRVCLLTGTIRGHERDLMAKENPVFRDFLSKKEWTPAGQTTYLVSTSAGEVGVDFDADHLVCDLTTLESMAQRFGRVNRLGGTGRSAEITVVDAPLKDNHLLKSQIDKTREILRAVEKRAGNVAPSALAKVLESTDAQAGFSPPPTILPATDILFDSWALTSIMGDLPGRPEVGPYLHGVADWEPPDTQVAWRAEIGELAQSQVAPDDLAEMLEAFPIRAAERLKDTTGRVLAQLAAIAARRPETQAVVIKNGEPRWITLSDLASENHTRNDAARRFLNYATVLLPVEAGGLKDGVLDGSCEAPVEDVAEIKVAGQRDRQRVRVNGDQRTGLIVPEVDRSLPKRCKLKVGDPDVHDDETPRPCIEYRVAKAESGEPGRPVLLSDHSAAVEGAAGKIGDSLVPRGIAEALALAGRWHDRGKDRRVWQRYARNYGYDRAQNPSPPLAKSRDYGDPRTDLNGYRHEFGSLLSAAVSGEIKDHPERDLILHLIASHHGWARPHFKHEQGSTGTSAYDPARQTPENEAGAADAMRRYAVLQRRFGRWGLAWLESLHRAADAAASEGGAG